MSYLKQQPSLLHFPGFSALKYPVPEKPLCSFNKRLVIIGGGAICAALLPVLEKLVQVDWKKSTIIDVVNVKDRYPHFAALGTKFVIEEINKNNYTQILAKYLAKGDMLVEIAYNLRTYDLLVWCQDNGVFYFNTALYEWSTVDDSGNFSHTVHEQDSGFLSMTFGQMKHVKELNEKKKNSTTSVVCHGANPGFVNHLIKQGIVDLVRQMVHDFPTDPNTPLMQQYLKEKNYPKLAQLAGVKIIQISEFDSQRAPITKEKNSFINSWNIPSFCEEAAAQAAFPYGIHEKKAPEGTKFHNFKGNRFVQLPSRAMHTLTASWAPGIGDFYGSTPHHEETITMADFCTVRNSKGEVEYAPTVWFCYRPMDLACHSLKEFEQNNFKIQDKRIIAREEINDGRDNLGLFILGHRYKGWWIGSLLSIQETRATGAKGVNATTLQVGASLAASICWAIQNPNAGIHFPESLPSEEVLHLMKPWMGPWVSMPVDWTPHGETNPTEDTWTFTNLLNPSYSSDDLFAKPKRTPSSKL